MGAYRQPRVVQVSTARSWRGGEQQLLLLAQGLERRGVHCLIVAPPQTPLLARAREAGLETRALRLYSEVDLRGAFKLANILRKFGAEILHLHGAIGILPAALAARWYGGMPLVLHRHTSFAVRGAWLYRRLPERLIAVCRASAEGLIRTGVPRDRIEVIFAGMQPPKVETDARRRLRAELEIGRERVAILCAASLSPEKDHATLLRAFALLPSPRPLLLLAGEGWLEGALHRLIGELGLAHEVRFLGFRSDLDQLLAACDIFALASTQEGLNTALIQAQMLALPAVATRAGGNGEIVEQGVTGLLVPARDPQELAAALWRLAQDRELRHSMGAAARRRSTALFSAQQMIDQTHSLYQTMRGIRD